MGHKLTCRFKEDNIDTRVVLRYTMSNHRGRYLGWGHRTRCIHDISWSRTRLWEGGSVVLQPRGKVLLGSYIYMLPVCN